MDLTSHYTLWDRKHYIFLYKAVTPGNLFIWLGFWLKNRRVGGNYCYVPVGAIYL